MGLFKFNPGNFRGITVNFRAWLGSLDAKMQLATEQAARVWLREAVQNVPDWSGASRATFEQLADAVGETVEINVAANAPDRIALGRMNSRGGIERIGKASWRFYYENNLRYLAANETQSVAVGEAGVRWGLIEPTPYNFRDAANQAAESFVENITLPRIEIQSR